MEFKGHHEALNLFVTGLLKIYIIYFQDLEQLIKQYNFLISYSCSYCEHHIFRYAGWIDKVTEWRVLWNIIDELLNYQLAPNTNTDKTCNKWC